MSDKKSKKPVKVISAEEFDAKFDRGEDVSEYFDDNNWTKRFPIEMPIWMMKEIEKEAARQGITRQSLIKTWLTGKLDELAEKRKQVRK